MYEYVRGALVEKSPTLAVIDAGGVGYALDIPVSTYDMLPEEEQHVKLLAHFHVREDVQKLYGFFSVAERDAFRKLIGISKIGPRAALSVLSSVSVRDLAEAVRSQDPSRLKAIPGVGPKTAQRLVMELKGKLEGADSEAPLSTRSSHTPARGISQRDEIFSALASLGYSEAQVQRALARAGQTLEETAPIEEWIRKALQVI
jgi:Holliday junction DNA helicase RuvA